MRYLFDTNGTNITSSGQSTLLAATSLPVADLFWFQYVDPGNASAGGSLNISNLYMTNAPYPIQVNKVQNQPGPAGLAVINATYQPSRIKRGALNYEIGLQDQTVDVTWDVNDSVVLGGGSLGFLPWGFKWALLAGYMDDCPMFIHKAYFNPASGPGTQPTLLGTTLMWRGFVRDVKADRSQLTITLGSLLHIFNSIQIPTQTIQPGNRIPAFLPAAGVQVFGASLGVVPAVTSTPTDIQFSWPGVPGAYPDHSLRDCFFTAHQQPPPNGWDAHNMQPAPAMYRIRDNIFDGTYEHIYPYEPINPVHLICLPNGVNQFLEIFFQMSPNVVGGVAGFPYVPPPEVSF